MIIHSQEQSLQLIAAIQNLRSETQRQDARSVVLRANQLADLDRILFCCHDELCAITPGPVLNSLQIALSVLVMIREDHFADKL